MIELYTWSTPNGCKISILLEAVEPTVSGARHRHIQRHQITPEFLQIAPNNRIPSIVDHETGINLMKSAAIMFHLADKYNRFQCTRTKHWRLLE